MKPLGGFSSDGRPFLNPRHSYAPVPGTGRRPTHPWRTGDSAAGRHEMLFSTSPQIRFSVAVFQYIAASRNALQLRAWARRSPPRYGAVPGSAEALLTA